MANDTYITLHLRVLPSTGNVSSPKLYWTIEQAVTGVLKMQISALLTT